MDPLIEAALVGAGASGIVAIVAFLTTRSTTRMQLAAARAERIWNKRAEAYADTLMALGYRSGLRDLKTGKHGLDDEGTRRLGEFLTTQRQPAWQALETCLQAFADPPVFTALQASSVASEKAMAAFRASSASQDDAAARDAFETAWAEASDADDRVVEAVRTALLGKGSPLGDWRP